MGRLQLRIGLIESRRLRALSGRSGAARVIDRRLDFARLRHLKLIDVLRDGSAVDAVMTETNEPVRANGQNGRSSDPKLIGDLLVDSARLTAYRMYTQANHGIDDR